MATQHPLHLASRKAPNPQCLWQVDRAASAADERWDEWPSRLSSFGTLPPPPPVQVQVPQLDRVALAQIGAQQIAPFATAHRSELVLVQAIGEAGLGRGHLPRYQ